VISAARLSPLFLPAEYRSIEGPGRRFRTLGLCLPWPHQNARLTASSPAPQEGRWVGSDQALYALWSRCSCLRATIFRGWAWVCLRLSGKSVYSSQSSLTP
jgi:hypothetical protein